MHDIMFRAVGDTIALTPPLIVSEDQIGEMFDKVAKIIKARGLTHCRVREARRELAVHQIHVALPR